MCCHFNSRPHRGRLVYLLYYTLFIAFQLTPSQRATFYSDIQADAHNISTHALTEGDILISSLIPKIKVFQLTPSQRATKCRIFFDFTGKFQLTPSQRATLIGRIPETPERNFNSRPHRGRQKEESMTFKDIIFQLTPSQRATRSRTSNGPFRIFQLTPSQRATANLDKFFF